MDRRLTFSTDAGTLAIFDPGALDHRVAGPCDWWCSGLEELDEVRSGVIALVGVGGDGAFGVRVTDGELDGDERDYATSDVRGLGVEVTTGRLFVGAAECLPGEGLAFEDDPDGQGGRHRDPERAL